MRYLALTLVALALPHGPHSIANAEIVTEDRAYQYGGAAFSQFIADSFGRPSGAQKFYNWFDGAYRSTGRHAGDRPDLGFRQYLVFKRTQLRRVSDPGRRTVFEERFARDLFKIVKTVIPKFSFDRGYEFTSAVTLGERQCFLQSVLIAGCLQAGGMSAGVAMVSKNSHGEEINNGHAVCIARLSDGRDVLVDASEDSPFIRQQGLFVSDGKGGHDFLSPVFDGMRPEILAYRTIQHRRTVATRDMRTLDIPFIRSQFEYYRGERAPGGIMASRMTDSGLNAGIRHFKISERLCPQNPLTLFMLARSYHAKGLLSQARHTLDSAVEEYRLAGWIPPEPLKANEIW